MKSLSKIIIISVYILTIQFSSPGYAQEHTWEFDKYKERERKNVIIHDSLMNHMKRKIELSVGYGPFFFSNNKADTTISNISFPKRINQWQFMVAWHALEKLTIDLTVGTRIDKDIPERPSILGVINGNDIKIEGGGGGMISILIGAKYYFLKNKLRPYLGIKGGVCKMKTQFTEVVGNINDGIERTDIKENETVRLMELELGIDYRLGKRINAGIGFQWEHSTSFNEISVGYKKISGLTVMPRLAILLF